MTKTQDEVIKKMVDLTHELEEKEKSLEKELNEVKQKLCFMGNLPKPDFVEFMGKLFEIMKQYKEVEKDGK